MEKVKLTRSSGNVFRDLGFSGDEAEYLKLRADLMVNLQKLITARGLKQAEAAELLGVTQRIGTTNATSAGAAGVRPGLGSPVNPAADPKRPFRGGRR